VSDWYRQEIAKEPRLSGLVEKFGACAVWQAGLDLLGFPATWDINGEQLIQLGRYLSLKTKG
jgi:hypothetical protein